MIGSGLRKEVTPYRMGGDRSENNLTSLLIDLKDEVACVHDIRLRFSVEGFYERLQSVPHPRSGDKLLGLFKFEKARSVRAVAHHSGTLSILVGCSLNPFPRDNLNDLIFMLERPGTHSVQLHRAATKDSLGLRLDSDSVAL